MHSEIQGAPGDLFARRETVHDSAGSGRLSFEYFKNRLIGPAVVYHDRLTHVVGESELLQEGDLNSKMELWLGQLTEKQRIVVERRFGLNGYERATFAADPRDIDWRRYWIDVHVPGLRRWVYPRIEGRRVPPGERRQIALERAALPAGVEVQ